ncbi:MAG: hypothetical protein ACHQZQ_08360 [SAR324 cluster bacterium]
MRGHIPIDTLAIVQRLREAGFQSNQAEAVVEVIADLVYGQVATKRDLEPLATKEALQSMELRITLRFSAMLAAAVAIVAALVKLL